MSFLIAFFTVVLLLVSLFMILIILMQKAKTDGGMGAAMGGGAAESAFGAETNTVLRKGTIYCSIVFFVLSFGIYLAHQHQRYQAERPSRGIEEIRPAEESGGATENPAMPNEPDGSIDGPVVPEAGDTDAGPAPENGAAEVSEPGEGGDTGGESESAADEESVDESGGSDSEADAPVPN